MLRKVAKVQCEQPQAQRFLEKEEDSGQNAETSISYLQRG